MWNLKCISDGNSNSTIELDIDFFELKLHIDPEWGRQAALGKTVMGKNSYGQNCVESRTAGSEETRSHILNKVSVVISAWVMH